MKHKLFIGLIIVILLLLVAIIIPLRQAGTEKIREADRFSMPVIERVMNQLSSWNYRNLKPYLHKKFIRSLSEKEFQQELDGLSVLGKVIEFKNVRHVRHASYKHWLYGKCAVNKYSVPTQFEKGKGVIIFNVNHCFEEAKISFFQVHSKALPVKSPAFE